MQIGQKDKKKMFNLVFVVVIFLSSEGFAQNFLHHHQPSSFNNGYDVIKPDLPDALDWRDKGVVSDPKNQGSCDAGWAFALIGAIEGQYAQKYGELLEFSAQELLDCLYECDGCHFCKAFKALDYLENLGGLLEESDYPFVGKPKRCRYKEALSRVTVTHHSRYTVQNEGQLKQALADEGPLYIAVDGTALENYKGGIMDTCSFNGVNHAVLLVGYDSENGVDYWIIKNSKGISWGEGGYARLRLGNNCCGIQSSGVLKISIEKP